MNAECDSSSAGKVGDERGGSAITAVPGHGRIAVVLAKCTVTYPRS